MEVIIKPLSEELTEDFLDFFDNIAFTDNKEWSGCYCCFYHFAMSDEEWVQRSGEINRMSAVKLIREGKLTGYLAYQDEKPIGWCNVNDKNNFSRLVTIKEVIDGKDEKICSIVCFIIAPEHRRKGVAGQILNKICNDYSNREYDYIEAYPRKGELTSAMHYHGPLSMYKRAGFSIYKEFNDYDIVRRKL